VARLCVECGECSVLMVRVGILPIEACIWPLVPLQRSGSAV
jgi:hypothetical protein